MCIDSGGHSDCTDAYFHTGNVQKASCARFECCARGYDIIYKKDVFPDQLALLFNFKDGFYIAKALQSALSGLRFRENSSPEAVFKPGDLHGVCNSLSKEVTLVIAANVFLPRM